MSPAPGTGDRNVAPTQPFASRSVARTQGDRGRRPIYSTERPSTPTAKTEQGERARGRDRRFSPTSIVRLPAREREGERGGPARLAVQVEGAAEHPHALPDPDDA